MWDHKGSDIGHSDWCDEPLDDDGNCAVCDARHEAEVKYWRPLYEGEKVAGLLEEPDER